MRRRLADERGFSLIELLTSMLVGGVIITAALGLLNLTMKKSRDVTMRAEASQRARIGMEAITRQLRSSVCLPDMRTTPVVAANGTSVTFYADLRYSTTAAPGVPERRTLRYDAASKKIMQDISTGTAAADGAITWGTPKTTTLITNVEPVGSTPIFRFYSFTAASPPELNQLTGTLTTTQLPTVIRTAVKFNVKAASGAPAKSSVILEDAVTSRLVNPNRAKTGVVLKMECT